MDSALARVLFPVAAACKAKSCLMATGAVAIPAIRKRSEEPLGKNAQSRRWPTRFCCDGFPLPGCFGSSADNLPDSAVPCTEILQAGVSIFFLLPKPKSFPKAAGRVSGELSVLKPLQSLQHFGLILAMVQKESDAASNFGIV